MSFLSSSSIFASFNQNRVLDAPTLYSTDIEIKKVQENAEELKIYESLMNIVNKGNTSKNNAGESEWESCKIHYHPILLRMPDEKDNFIIGQIIMPDGTVLYEASMRLIEESGVITKYRSTQQFRFGKWVDRFLRYSEELTQQYLLEVETRHREMEEQKRKPFAEIDF